MEYSISVGHNFFGSFWALIHVAVFEVVSGYGGVGLSLGLPYVSGLDAQNDPTILLMVVLRRITPLLGHGPLSPKLS